jgi:hypothetical protein
MVMGAEAPWRLELVCGKGKKVHDARRRSRAIARQQAVMTAAAAFEMTYTRGGLPNPWRSRSSWGFQREDQDGRGSRGTGRARELGRWRSTGC